MVVGDYDALARIAEMVPDMPGFARKSTEEILEVATRIRHPDDMISQHAEVGEWPATAPESPQLSVAFDMRSGAPLPRAHIVILPTDEASRQLFGILRTIML